MKRAIHLLLIISSFVSVRVSAQNLEITDLSNNIVNGTTIFVDTSDINVPTLDVYLNVKNNTGMDLNDLYVRRIINSEADTSFNSFCLGTCFLPTTDTSTPAIVLAQGESVSFSGDYYPNLCSGLTSITYEFFDNRSSVTPITAQVTINFRVSPLGIVHDAKSFNISEAFPNPSSTYATIVYNLPVSSGGKIVLHNLIGSIVREVNLEKQVGRVAISTSDLKEGVYFYSFIFDNKIVVTKKLVIRH